jgi:hypothetical protein
MATTTNYSWTTPDNTAYVKDGASAIRTLGSSVDSTLFTALGGAYAGMRLIKKQTVGTGVSSITVTDAFSATYDNYKIIYAGYVNSGGGAAVYLRTGADTVNYNTNAIVISTSGVVSAVTGITNFTTINYTSTAQGQIDLDVYQPFKAAQTVIQNRSYQPTQIFIGGGINGNATSGTSFNLTAQASQTFTGGVIYVYGYGAS